MYCQDTVKWLYRIDEDFVWNCRKTLTQDYSFRDRKGIERLVLKADGGIIVRRDYAWDGCTPKFCLLDILWGVPDGAVHRVTNKPKTYYASLVHDALYQFLDDQLPYSRNEADEFFLQLMQETDFTLRGLYYLAVRVFGSLFRWYSMNYGKKKPR